jgi:hypothetical protein
MARTSGASGSTSRWSRWSRFTKIIPYRMAHRTGCGAPRGRRRHRYARRSSSSSRVTTTGSPNTVTINESPLWGTAVAKSMKCQPERYAVAISRRKERSSGGVVIGSAPGAVRGRFRVARTGGLRRAPTAVRRYVARLPRQPTQGPEGHDRGESSGKHRAKHSVPHSRLRPHLKVSSSPVEYDDGSFRHVMATQSVHHVPACSGPWGVEIWQHMGHNGHIPMASPNCVLKVSVSTRMRCAQDASPGRRWNPLLA